MVSAASLSPALKSLYWPSADRNPAIWIWFCSNVEPMSAISLTANPVMNALSAVPAESSDCSASLT